MLIQELFRRAAMQHNQVIQEIAGILAPAILRELAIVPALGGSGESAGIADPEVQELLESLPTFSDEERLIFSQKGFDQSLSTHLINGLFAGMNLAERLPEVKKLDTTEQRIWVLGYAVHDYTKAYGRKVSAGQLPAIRQLVSRLGTLLDFTEFMPDWCDYLDDIVFTAQNTQTVQGANLNIRDYACHIDKRQRETIRLLSSVTDLLVHITSPSDVVHRDARGRDLAYNLRQKMDALFGYEIAPRLTYHKLLEVRGLLSNLINNAIIEELRTQGYESFLFFPEGVIYLAPRNVQAQLTIEHVIKKVWKRIVALLTGNISSEEEEDDEDHEKGEGGLRIQRTKDYMKVQPILYELLDVESLMEAGLRAALAIHNSKTAARLGAERADELGLDFKRLNLKEREIEYTALGQVWATEHKLLVDVRVDQLAEFLIFLQHRVFAELCPKLPDSAALLLNALDLREEVAPERAKHQRTGGTPTGWFFAAACYLRRHPELDPHDLQKVMNHVLKTSLDAITASGFFIQKEGSTATIFRTYMQQLIEIDGSLIFFGGSTTQNLFIEEIKRYIRSKDENKVVCSLCSSPFDAQEQDKSVVLFKPQQYSNKSRLDRSQLLRGICPICALEMMLRQVQQGLVAGKAQDQQTSFLYLYPTYFFTAETAEVVKLFVGRLQHLNLSRLIFSHLEKTSFQFRNLLTYEDFLLDEDRVILPKGKTQSQYSDEDIAALFFLPFRPSGAKLTETDTWVVPTFFALALPLLLGVKCVATTSFTLLYKSAGDFQETVRLDGPHPFTTHILAKDRLRLNEIPSLIVRLLRIYSLHLDVYADDRNSHWGQLTNLAKDLVTDPLYVFQYYDRYKRRDEDRQAKAKSKGKQRLPMVPGNKGVSVLEKQRYMGIYYALGGTHTMGFIGELVEAYAQFYRTRNLDSAYAVLRPLSTAIDVVVDSDPRTDIDDLHLLVAGALNDDQERVRAAQAEGFDPIVTNKALGDYGIRLALSRQKIEEFTHLLLDKCFIQYCDSDRALLRERTNRFRSAARFYYLTRVGF